jgi:aryl-alcohol dehydrogenase-like predicted oxidoreductase
LIGASSTAQVEENVRALHGLAFTPEELRCIDAITEAEEKAER